MLTLVVGWLGVQIGMNRQRRAARAIRRSEERYARVVAGSSPDPTPFAESPSLAGKSILIADDDDLARQTLARVLERHGGQIEAAGDGEQGLARFTPGNFDAVLCDLRMPGIDGWEVAARMDEIDPACPVIILTGHVDIDNDATNHPMVAAFLPKPCTTAELLLTIGRVTGG